MCDVVQNSDPRDLLAWYDKNARDLPWRVGPASLAAGLVPDPYAVWLSEIMLQQTTVAAVKAYFLRFMEIWPDVTALANADDAHVMGEWAGLGYYARARNLLKCARQVVKEHNGHFPQSYETLLKLPGIGPYTAAAIAAIAFDHPETVVDGNIERVMARLFAVTDPLPASKPTLYNLAKEMTPAERAGDYAQAVMDLGATICTPKSPNCGGCPWRSSCRARAKGIAASLPARLPKTKKPTRFGTAFAARRVDGAWLLERRPDKGLLGGMLGWPGTEWAEDPATPIPPADATWHDTDIEVRHTFTHFHLRLSVRVATLSQDCQPSCGSFVAPQDFRASELPTIMRKIHALAKAKIDEHH